MYVYIHIYLCISVYVYIQIYMYMHIHVCLYIYTCIFIHIYLCICTYIYICIPFCSAVKNSLATCACACLFARVDSLFSCHVVDVQCSYHFYVHLSVILQKFCLNWTFMLQRMLQHRHCMLRLLLFSFLFLSHSFCFYYTSIDVWTRRRSHIRTNTELECKACASRENETYNTHIYTPFHQSLKYTSICKFRMREQESAGLTRLETLESAVQSLENITDQCSVQFYHIVRTPLTFCDIPSYPTNVLMYSTNVH